MKAIVRSVRIAPKKANIVATMVRGMAVEEAMTMLSRTHKKAARIIEELLRSAIANATHNDKQSASTLVVKTIVVNQGAAFRRGVPMARGRVRPMKKFLSHIEVTLGVADEDAVDGAAAKESKEEKKTKPASQSAKKPVQRKPKTTKAAKDAQASPASSPSAEPSSSAK